VNNQKGISTIIIILITAVILVGGAGSYLFISESEPASEFEISKKAIDDSVLNYVNKSGQQNDDYSFSLSNISSNFSRGEYINSSTGEKTNLFFVKIDNEWKIVAAVKDTPSCERMEKIGFPSNMLADCALDFPNAKKASEVNSIVKAYNTNPGSGFGSDSGNGIQIIGDFVLSEDPSCDCFYLESEGETVEISYNPIDVDSDIFEFEEGDTVVIDVDISEDDSGTSVNIVDVVDQINDTDDSDEDSDEGASSDGKDLSEEVYYDITDLPPGVAPPGADFYEALFDIDNSDIEIRILSDF